MSASANRCPKCGTAIRPGAGEGLCPRCLLRGAMRFREKVVVSEEGDSTLPRLFADYELRERIATGGMGVVFRAWHPALAREVALKMIRVGQLAGVEEVRRFRLEALAAARLDHPNIVPILEIGEQDGVQYFTMKLAEGGSLAGRKLETRAAVALLSKVARAVHHAHQRGVLHRDLKPSNILLDPTGAPMVADFGLARLAQGSDITLSGAAIGTPAYMAPEQASGGAGFTTVSDVFSLGSVLYTLLIGVPAFGGVSDYETMRCVIEEEPPRIAGLVGVDLEAIVMKCLEKEPARRYRSAAALADDLDCWLAGKPVQARRAMPWERAWKWARRRPAMAGLVAVCVGAALTLVTLQFLNERSLRRERNYARAQEQTATEQARLAALAAARAQESERSTRLHLYAADVYRAGMALAEGNYGLAREALAAQIPRDGAADLRGFEWYHLWSRSTGDASRDLPEHSAPVGALAFSADGRKLACGGHDGRSRVFQVQGGVLHTQVPSSSSPPPSALEHLVMAPVLGVSPDARAYFADDPTRYAEMLMRTRVTSKATVRSVALSPDGLWLATGSQWNWIRIWHLADRKLAWVIPAVDCVGLAFTPSGNLIAGDAVRGTVRIFDGKSHHRTGEMENVHGRFALSGDGGTLAVAARDGTVQLRSPTDGRLLRSFSCEGSEHGMALSHDGAMVAVVAADGLRASLWATADGRRLGEVSHGALIRAVALSADGRTLATGGADHAVRLWDAASLREIGRLKGHGDEVLSVAFSPDGQQLATGARDHSVKLWELSKTAALSPAALHVQKARSFDGSTVLDDPPGGRSAIVDMEGLRRELPEGWRILGHGAGRSAAAWNKETREFRFFEADGKDESPAVRFESAGAEPRAAAYDRGSDTFAILWADSISVHAAGSGARMRSIPCTRNTIGILYSRGGTQILAFRYPSTLELYHVPSGELRHKWSTANSEILAYTFSPDGRLVACGGKDNVVSVFDTRMGQPLASLRGHKSEVCSVAFSPDGRTLASGSAGRTLKLWHTPTWRELATLSNDRVFSFLEFSRDGTVLGAQESFGELHRFTGAVPK